MSSSSPSESHPYWSLFLATLLKLDIMWLVIILTQSSVTLLGSDAEFSRKGSKNRKTPTRTAKSKIPNVKNNETWMTVSCVLNTFAFMHLQVEPSWHWVTVSSCRDVLVNDTRFMNTLPGSLREIRIQFSHYKRVIQKASFRNMLGTNFDSYIMKGLDASCKGRSPV